jgi:methyl-accepting chemotaxis protein
VKNLKLSVKVAVLVAVLLTTVLIVAVVGVVQLSRLDARFDQVANTTSKAVWLSGDGRIEMLTAVRGEKNAMLVSDKAQAAEFADQARQAVDRLKELSSELEAIVGANPSSPEGRAVSELPRANEEFEKNDKDLLRLAVMKTNVEAQRIVNEEFYHQARDLQDYLAGLSTRSVGTNPPTTVESDPVRQAAGRQALDRLYELMFLLTLHINSSDEQEMNRLDSEIAHSTAALQDATRRFASSLGESERYQIAPVLSSIEGIKPRVTQVQQLSRTNSDNLARNMSISQGIAVGNRGTALLDQARKALKDRVADDAREVAAAAQMGREIVISTGLVGGLISLVLAVLIIRSITKPIGQGVRVFEAMAGGDLTKRMNLESQDEIGRLGAASDRMATAVCDVVSHIRVVAGRLGHSAGELANVSNDLLSQSHEMTTQAESVAAGTEQMSTNVSTMAAAAEQMSVNVSGISSASEEVSVNVGSIVQSADATSRSVGAVAESINRITASLKEVARDAKHGSQITQQAREMAAAATGTMRQLDQAASEITKVTEVIKSIALQTNLLALNATIEATSAGEAGKGFAVVAGEVKELASQSAQSAEDIARKIECVQTSTREAVKVIENVAQFVGQVNVSAGRISEAVDGQTEAAGQIESGVEQARRGVESIARAIAEVGKGATDVSRNTSEAAGAANDVSRNASEAAKAAETVSSNIQGVSEATRLSTASATKLNEAARQLSQLASELQQIVSRFRIEDRQATATA